MREGRRDTHLSVRGRDVGAGCRQALIGKALRKHVLGSVVAVLIGGGGKPRAGDDSGVDSGLQLGLAGQRLTVVKRRADQGEHRDGQQCEQNRDRAAFILAKRALCGCA